MAERKVGWEPQGQHTIIGKEVQRTDGKQKASGQAKYSNDANPPGTLFAKLLTCPHAHAKLVAFMMYLRVVEDRCPPG